MAVKQLPRPPEVAHGLFAGVRMGRKRAMAYPSPSHASSPSGTTAPNSALHNGTAGFRRGTAAPPTVPARSSEGEHQLEKLEFALAVAITRGDAARSAALREQIAALGGNCEEPGT
jgi:nucleoid-associated protein YgaU